ncbi:MAG: T9SS C-terminal target domain-containing protein [Bacteroidetes bacterium]|nr:MAG: T9SS C-terminal target domain-containing protein [Bacteroidota bacterium]
MRKTHLFLAFVFLGGSLTFAQPQIELQLVAGGFTRPVDIASAGDERLFVVEQTGRIKIIDGEGNVLPVPFLDIDDRVNSGANERGLLGLVFHPNYAENGYFYVNYTDNSGGDTRISRFRVSADDPNRADPASEVILLEIDQPFSNHNAGDLAFGPDGYLYVPTGDGGSGGDPGNRAQNPQSLLGKMLRFDLGPDGDQWNIPADNPFVGNPDVRDEIWALGLRNPWRISFDRLTGDLWIADVGQDAWEEIDFVPAPVEGGLNFGWRCYEGNHPFNTGNCPPIDSFTFPIHEYANNFSTGCSVTGGFVYRGCAYPELYGHYLYTDFCTGKFWVLRPDGQGGWENFEIANLANQEYSSFGEDRNGELYVAALGEGRIYRIVETQQDCSPQVEIQNPSCPGANDGSIALSWPQGCEPTAVLWCNGATTHTLTDLPAGPCSATVTYPGGCQQTLHFRLEEPAPLEVEITLQNDTLFAPAGLPGYLWLLDGNPIAGADQPFLVPTQSGDYQLQVTDANGCVFLSNTVSVIISGIAELPALQHFALHPNPAREQIHLTLTFSQPTALQLTLLDIQGKPLRQTALPPQTTHRHTLPLNDLPPGLYLLLLETPRGRALEKVLVASGK